MTPTEKSALVRLYMRQLLSLDKLPYTPEFHEMVRLYNAEHRQMTHHEIYNTLIRLRKAGDLPRKCRLKRSV